MLKHHLKFTSVLFIITAAFCYLPATQGSQETEAPEIVTPDKKVDPPESKMILEVQTASWCGPCRKMKASGVLEDLKKLGWEVRIVEKGLGRMYPTFRVTIKGKQETFTGFSSKSRLISKLNTIRKRLDK